MLKPQNGYVLSKIVQKSEEQVIENGIKYSKQSMPIYEIIDMSNLSIDLELSKNDWIITNSIPTRVKSEDQEYYLISQDHIAVKIEK